MEFTKEQRERYARHFVLKEIGEEGQRKLSEAKVLVIGAGGLGSASLLYLAAAGVGTLGVADFDTVDVSNLQRQIIHRTDRAGMAKTESAAISIGGLNPEVQVRQFRDRVTVDNILPLIGEYDFIIDATDSFESKLLVNDACVLAKKPFSHAGIIRFEGQAMTWVPGQGPCIRCVMGDVPPRNMVASGAQVGVLGAAVGVLGSIQATEAIKFITGRGKLLTGRLLLFDGLSMQFTEMEMKTGNPHCRICGVHADITSLAENRLEYEQG